MIEKLKALKKRYDEINELMGKPEIVSDREKYAQLAKESRIAK